MFENAVLHCSYKSKNLSFFIILYSNTRGKKIWSKN